MVKYLLVKDLYRADAVSIEASATIKEALHKMNTKGTNGLLILDKETVIGVLSLQDITGAIVPHEMRDNTSLAGAMYKAGYFEEGARKLSRKKVTELMRTDFLTVTRQASLMEIAADFLQNDLYIVPVVEDGKLVGVVTRTEIRHVFASAMAS